MKLKIVVLLLACAIGLVNATSVTAGPVTLSQNDFAFAIFPSTATHINDVESAWAVKWKFEPHPNKPGEYIWVISDAFFLRKIFDVNKNSSFEWIKVLDRLAPAAMFVPYVENGQRYRDIAAYYTGIASLDQASAPQTSLRNASILHENMLGSTRRPVVMQELTDHFVRWMRVGPGGYSGVAKSKRGEALVLWSMFSAYNYVYPTKFSFRDDGVIEARMAASGGNIANAPIKKNTHAHMAAWNMELNLCAYRSTTCDESHVEIKTVSRRVTNIGASTQEEIILESFNNGVEGGADWVPEEFTALLISNPRQPNLRPIDVDQHVELSREPIGYALLPIRRGTAQYKAPGLPGSPPNNSEDFLDHVFWVTKKPNSTALPETLFTQVQNYANNEPLSGNPKVIWHKTAYNHIPRYEDLGFNPNNFGFDKTQGVALTSFAGFDLVPRNLMHVTPGYP